MHGGTAELQAAGARLRKGSTFRDCRCVCDVPLIGLMGAVSRQRMGDHEKHTYSR